MADGCIAVSELKGMMHINQHVQEIFDIPSNGGICYDTIDRAEDNNIAEFINYGNSVLNSLKCEDNPSLAVLIEDMRAARGRATGISRFLSDIRWRIYKKHYQDKLSAKRNHLLETLPKVREKLKEAGEKEAGKGDYWMWALTFAFINERADRYKEVMKNNERDIKETASLGMKVFSDSYDLYIKELSTMYIHGLAKIGVQLMPTVNEEGACYCFSRSSPKLHQFKVSYVFPRGPADRAGVKKDDVIVEIDGVQVSGLSMPEAVGLLYGSCNSIVTLVVERGEEIFHIPIEKELHMLVFRSSLP